MKSRYIKEQHIYYVDFEPHKECEFDKRHLAIVLKKCSDKRTFIVVPLTTESNGVGTNKINLGKLSCLPNNLKQDDSYLVYNQVRTVNHERFYPLKDDEQNYMECRLDDELFTKSISFCIDEIATNITLSNKVECYKEKYIHSTVHLLIDTAYNIKRALDIPSNEDNILLFQKQICELLMMMFDYKKYISEEDKNRDIVDIIECCLGNNILSIYQINNKK